jgi:hypothetical protein
MKFMERNSVEDLDTGGIILKWHEAIGWGELCKSGVAQNKNSMAGCCERGDELPIFIRSVELFCFNK